MSINTLRNRMALSFASFFQLCHLVAAAIRIGYRVGFSSNKSLNVNGQSNASSARREITSECRTSCGVLEEREDLVPFLGKMNVCETMYLLSYFI